jgi:hypothetical protein
MAFHTLLLSIALAATAPPSGPRAMPPGVGWSISAAASGWGLQRVSNAGDRVRLSCLPVGQGRWSYAMDVQPGRLPDGPASERVSLSIVQRPHLWTYRLVWNGVSYRWKTRDAAAFAALLARINAMTPGDRFESPELRIDFSPRVGGQETTIQQFRRLCRL